MLEELPDELDKEAFRGRVKEIAVELGVEVKKNETLGSLVYRVRKVIDKQLEDFEQRTIELQSELQEFDAHNAWDN